MSVPRCLTEPARQRQRYPTHWLICAQVAAELHREVELAALPHRVFFARDHDLRAVGSRRRRAGVPATPSTRHVDGNQNAAAARPSSAGPSTRRPCSSAAPRSRWGGPCASCAAPRGGGPRRCRPFFSRSSRWFAAVFAALYLFPLLRATVCERRGRCTVSLLLLRSQRLRR